MKEQPDRSHGRRPHRGLVAALVLAGLGFVVWGPLRRPQAVASAGRMPLHVTGRDAYDRPVDEAAYRLRVTGNVDHELVLTLGDVRAMPAVERRAPLDCVLDWTDLARWRGVPIRDVLRQAGPLSNATFVVFRDGLGFSATLSAAYIEGGEAILAYEVNGVALPPEHGWPLRVVAPGKWGYKWVKWVTELEVTDGGYEGTYEGKGFSLDGDAAGSKLEADKQR